jgi:hypothetical protein
VPDCHGHTVAATLPLCHTARLPLPYCHTATATPPLCHSATLPYCHCHLATATLSIVPLCHTATLLLLLPHCHLPHCQLSPPVATASCHCHLSLPVVTLPVATCNLLFFSYQICSNIITIFYPNLPFLYLKIPYLHPKSLKIAIFHLKIAQKSHFSPQNRPKIAKITFKNP